ncbi:DUF1307 domain-containing protein [uncultured Faecalibaculum sp.]|uniref:DUF1307 domain-containing protein n=1 Tax=uncultured Faecalibaculum sp. TaxID=1729681 RepID=UPI00262DEE5E|nr:DUF1307 domain-containing protein [uncultured Faecalibaculum sp.]
MKKAWLALLCLALTGCVRVGGSNPETRQEEPDETETVKQTMTCSSDAGSYEFEALGDQVKKSVQTENVSFEELGLDAGADQAKIGEAISRVLNDSYGSLKGVSTQGEVRDNHVELTISIDYAQADSQALIDSGLLEPGELDSRYVSLERTETELTSQGFACRAG